MRMFIRNKACEQFYHRHMSNIGVRVYARRVLTPEDKILRIIQGLGKKTVLQEVLKYTGFLHSAQKYMYRRRASTTESRRPAALSQWLDREGLRRHSGHR
jgi:hypothetical protein